MIGFDLQEVKLKNPEKLLEKIALETEISYIQKFKRDFSVKVASLWSVKEAVFKALGGGEFSYKEIELCHKKSGEPFVRLYGKAQQKLESLKAKGVEISISHQKNIVGAVAILVF